MQFLSHFSSSTGNLYTLHSGDHTLLIEAGVRIKKIRQNVNITGLSACLCSHFHSDHAKGISDLVKAAVDCYMTQPTAEKLGVIGHHRVHIIEPLKQFAVDDYWKILPFSTQHDCTGSVGFLVSDGSEKLLFATDTFYVRYLFKGINILAVECNWSPETLAPDLDPVVKKRLLTSHFSLANALKFLEANDLSQCRELHLIHLSSGNSDEKLFANKVRAATGIPVYVASE
jgi:phosphoribosyl 1,2-cyclic phosphodiesterase